MKQISFAWTTSALLAGRKTCTCRDWDDDYARRFKAGDLVAAYDRSPRYGGKQIAVIQLTHDATYGALHEIVPGWFEQEGFAWMDEQVAAGNADVAKAIRKAFGLPPGMTLKQFAEIDNGSWGQWVVRFELKEVME